MEIMNIYAPGGQDGQSVKAMQGWGDILKFRLMWFNFHNR